MKIVIILRAEIVMVDQKIISICSILCQFGFSFQYMKSHFVSILCNFVTICININVIKNRCRFYMFTDILIKLLSIQNAKILSEFALIGIKHAVFMLPPSFRCQHIALRLDGSS